MTTDESLIRQVLEDWARATSEGRHDEKSNS